MDQASAKSAVLSNHSSSSCIGQWIWSMPTPPGSPCGERRLLRSKAIDRGRISGRPPKSLPDDKPLYLIADAQRSLQSSSPIPFKPPRNWLCDRALERNWRRRALLSRRHACAGLSAAAFLRHEAAGWPTDLRVNLRHSGKLDVGKRCSRIAPGCRSRHGTLDDRRSQRESDAWAQDLVHSHSVAR